jgi:hypothetical protein
VYTSPSSPFEAQAPNVVNINVFISVCTPFSFMSSFLDLSFLFLQGCSGHRVWVVWLLHCIWHSGRVGLNLGVSGGGLRRLVVRGQHRQVTPQLSCRVASFMLLPLHLACLHLRQNITKLSPCGFSTICLLHHVSHPFLGLLLDHFHQLPQLIPWITAHGFLHKSFIDHTMRTYTHDSSGPELKCSASCSYLTLAATLLPILWGRKLRLKEMKSLNWCTISVFLNPLLHHLLSQ